MVNNKQTNKYFIYSSLQSLILTGLLLSAAPVWAAQISVTTLSDDPASGCTLREAITSMVNEDVAVTGCANAGGAFGTSDTIDLMAGTHLLAGASDDNINTSGDLDINDVNLSLTINGHTSGSTIDAQQNDRVLDVKNGNITINNVTITGGNLANDFGGGVSNGGTLTFNGSTISGNTTGSGGGIYNSGTLNLTNSTVSSNTANLVSGGAIYSEGTLIVVNSTISNNTANTGTGGISTNATLIMSQSILAANHTSGLAVGLDCDGSNTITSQGYNMVESAGACAASFNGLGDQLGVDPILSPLALWGGTTATHVPLSGSPAIDAIPDVACSLITDQRGAGRNTLCDIGAVEIQAQNASNTISVNSTEDTIDNALADGICDATCSLRAAVMQANHNYANINSTNYVTIHLPAGEYALDLAGAAEEASAQGDIDINAPIMIIGVGAGQTIVHQTTADRVFHVGPNSFGSLSLQGVMVTGGATDVGGGIFVANGEKNFLGTQNVEIANNAATGNGGGIAIGINAGSEIRSSTIHHNTTQSSGGGLRIANGSKVKIINSTISSNSANIDGGGLSLNTNANVTILFSTITNNTADADNNGGGGGGFSNTASTFNLIGSILVNNINPNNNSPDCVGGVVGTFSLVGDTTGCTYNNNDDSALIDQSLSLFSLANYGGPVSTHALIMNSLAVDALTDPVIVSNYCPAKDARGVVREKAGNKCDIGAVELVGGLTVAVTPTTEAVMVGANVDYNIKITATSISGDATVIVTKPDAATATVTLPNGCVDKSATFTCTLTGMLANVEKSFVVNATAVAPGVATLGVVATAGGLKSGGSSDGSVTVTAVPPVAVANLAVTASSDISDVSLAELAPVSALAFSIANNGTGAGSVSAFNLELNELSGATVAYIVPVTLYRDNNGNGIVDNDDTAVAETTATTGAAFALSLENTQAIAAGSQVAYIVEIDPSNQTQVASLGGLGSLALNFPLMLGLVGLGVYGTGNRQHVSFMLLLLLLTMTAACGGNGKGNSDTNTTNSFTYQIKLTTVTAQDTTSGNVANLGGLPLTGRKVIFE